MKSLLRENCRFQALYDGVRLGLMKEKMEVMYGGEQLEDGQWVGD